MYQILDITHCSIMAAMHEFRPFPGCQGSIKIRSQPHDHGTLAFIQSQSLKQVSYMQRLFATLDCPFLGFANLSKIPAYPVGTIKTSRLCLAKLFIILALMLLELGGKAE